METTRVVWAQWPDVSVPAGVELLSGDIRELPAAERARIDFYVAPYLSGTWGLQPTVDMTRLSVLQVPNAGYDDALPYLRGGMTLCNARGVHGASTAELAVALTLAGRRGFAAFGKAQFRGTWSRSIEPSLAGSAVAIVGFGAIGRTIAELFSGWPVSVTGFSRSGTGGARPVAELLAALPQFDVVILVLPLTAESERMVDADFLARMKDGALLVNVARGRVVDTEALLAELNDGRLRAALDVTDPEPLPDGHPLFSAPNCLITPHVGGNTTAFPARMKQLIEAQLARWVAGEELANVVARG